MKLKLWITAAFIVAILSGCSMLPSPGDTIKPPAPPENREEKLEDLRAIVMSVLPSGAKLHRGSGDEIISPHDFDGDGKNEIFTAYELSKKELHAAVLQKQGEEWKKIWDIKGHGHAVNYIEALDLTGDGKLEWLIGWTIGASVGNGLDIYQWRNNTLEVLSSLAYHNVDIEDMPSEKGKDGIPELALWHKDTGLAYKVEVVRWDGTKFSPAEDVYPYYFKEKVVTYYSDKVKESPDTDILWYYLADAQLKAGMINEALESIEKGKKVAIAHKSPYPFEDLIQRAKHTVEYVFNNAKIGLSKEEVAKVFGSQYMETVSAKDNEPIWRYDYVAKEGYKFEEGMDSGDIQGLKNGSMKMQLFITWGKTNKAFKYSLLYKGKDGKVYQYTLNPDGGETNVPIVFQQMESNLNIDALKKGIMNDLGFGIGSKKIDIELKFKNDVEIKKDIQGGEYFQYTQYHLYFDDNNLVTRFEYRPSGKYSVEQIKNALGTPVYEGEDHSTSAWTLVYSFGEYKAVFYFNSEDKNLTYFKFYK
jgi:hypothetical protein